ncbi:MAG: NYN domain-containing protein [Campylobacterales bacterium]|nr:NYN domain-containing protein [Campylobacterales bacterium]NQY21868.1 NYN domain-containing protein [Campylobacteraceae bacterium]
MSSDKKIAIFFDCENVSSKYLDEIFVELAKVGQVMIRQAYNDWSSKLSRTWSEKLPMFAIKPIHISANVSSKNVSDFQIVIDVMNTMHYSNVDTIVLVSSDSDFTSLAIEIKSKAFEVIGFGEKKTPDSLKNAYSTFYELPLKKELEKSSSNVDIIAILINAINSTKGEDDYAYLAQIGTFLRNKNASLHPTNFGSDSWSNIFREYPAIFEVSYKDNIRSRIMVRLVEHIDF